MMNFYIFTVYCCQTDLKKLEDFFTQYNNLTEVLIYIYIKNKNKAQFILGLKSN